MSTHDMNTVCVSVSEEAGCRTFGLIRQPFRASLDYLTDGLVYELNNKKPITIYSRPNLDCLTEMFKTHGCKSYSELVVYSAAPKSTDVCAFLTRRVF